MQKPPAEQYFALRGDLRLVLMQYLNGRPHGEVRQMFDMLNDMVALDVHPNGQHAVADEQPHKTPAQLAAEAGTLPVDEEGRPVVVTAKHVNGN